MPPYRFDYDRLSGTGILVRTADGQETLRYVGADAERLSKASADELAAEWADLYEEVDV